MTSRTKTSRLVCFLPVLALIAFGPAPAHAADRQTPERLPAQDIALARVVAAMEGGQLGRALDEIDKLIAKYPNFRLAHLIRGDLLRAQAKPLVTFGNADRPESDRIGELRAEAMARLRAYRNPPQNGQVPRNLLQIPHSVKHVIVVDASRSRLYLFENRQAVPKLVAEFYATLGKRGIDKVREGDQKTPIGVYHVTSRIPGAKLPDLYGFGALPIDYPNEWDRRAGRTGYGIWLHGVPADTFARAPLASDGCIALANPDMERLNALVDVGATPVIISERIDWETPAAVRAEREAFARRLEEWRRDWESPDNRRYLANYARDFRNGQTNLQAWSAQKIAVNRSKEWIKVTLGNVSVFRSPGKDKVMVVTFDQDYRSSNLSQKSRKRQYWVEEAGRWRIAYEGLIPGAVLTMPESYKKARRS